jgi:hypothetical protein
MEPDLLTVCIAAFLAVVTLLGVLAGAIHLLGVVFPEREGGTDPAIIAAIHSAAASAYPGMRVTKIEEKR